MTFLAIALVLMVANFTGLAILMVGARADDDARPD
jgi:hypothetical protein